MACDNRLSVILVNMCVRIFQVWKKNIAIVTGLTAGIFGLTKSFVNYYWIYIAIEFFEGAIADPYSPLYMLSNFFIISVASL